MDDNEKLALDALAAATRYYCAQIDAANARINHLEDVLRALLDDDNEATRADAQRALECS
jgi:hypothetical protein